MRVVDFADYQKMERPGLKWLIHGLIPKPGRFLLIGAPKAGKTNLAVQIALAVSQGTDFIGSSVSPGRVLFLQFDTSEFEWREVMDRLHNGGVDIRGPKMVHPDDMLLPFNIQAQECKDWLREALKEAQPDLVVIDVLRELHLAEENSSTEMKIACTPLFQILAPYSVLILHHTTKLDEKFDYDPLKVARGSGYLSGAVSAIGLLHNQKLKVTHRLAPKLTFDCHMNEMGLWVFSGDGYAEAEIKERLLAEVASYPELSGNQLYEHVIRQKYAGVSRSTFFRKVGKALKKENPPLDETRPHCGVVADSLQNPSTAPAVSACTGGYTVVPLQDLCLVEVPGVFADALLDPLPSGPVLPSEGPVTETRPPSELPIAFPSAPSSGSVVGPPPT